MGGKARFVKAVRLDRPQPAPQVEKKVKSGLRLVK
jgi:hypothetical protein